MAQNTVYKYLKDYNAGDVIFRAGSPSKCMYEVQKGKVGLFSDYGTPDQKMLAEVGPERFFGEMGMVEGLPRSATAVVTEDYTTVAEITWDLLGLYFKTKPAKVVQIMQQMGDRLRTTTKAAIDLKNTVNEAIGELENGGTTKEALATLKYGIRMMDGTLKDNK